MVINVSFSYCVTFIFIFTVSSKKRLNQRVCFPCTNTNKINKNSQIIETIFMMRFAEAAIIG